jgi:Cu2+-exporting ATPase
MSITGKGVEATLEGKKILVVSPGYLKENKISIPSNYVPPMIRKRWVFLMINNETSRIH